VDRQYRRAVTPPPRRGSGACRQLRIAALRLNLMLVRFTKKGDGRHRLTIVRDDGTVSQGQVIPGLGPSAIPHDLLHALVEKTLGFSRGVYGMVNTGLDIAELLDPGQKRMNKGEAELMHSEIVTAELSAPTVSGDDRRELRRLRDDYQARWRALGVGETIYVDLALPRGPASAASRCS
jgi:hypothetical protein